MENGKITVGVSLVLSCILLLGSLFLLTSCADKWKPEVQGSQVLEMSYEEITDDYVVEKFTDFTSFSKSRWANYNFISQEVAQKERYSKEFFKYSDLIVVMFNMPEKGIDFTVTDIKLEGSRCIVELLPIKRISKVKQQPTTYCCFAETATDITSYDVTLVISDSIQHESQAFSYITDGNEFYTFSGQKEPILFVIDGKNGIDSFFEKDGVLSKQSFIYAQLSRYSEDTFENSSLMLVRLPSSDFEQLAAYFNEDTLYITGTYSNHYLYKKETVHSKLVALLIPKDFNVNEVVRTIYYEYEDDLKEKSECRKYSLNEQTNLADNLVEYTFASVSEND